MWVLAHPRTSSPGNSSRCVTAATDTLSTLLRGRYLACLPAKYYRIPSTRRPTWWCASAEPPKCCIRGTLVPAPPAEVQRVQIG